MEAAGHTLEVRCSTLELFNLLLDFIRTEKSVEIPLLSRLNGRLHG